MIVLYEKPFFYITAMKFVIVTWYQMHDRYIAINWPAD